MQIKPVSCLQDSVDAKHCICGKNILKIINRIKFISLALLSILQLNAYAQNPDTPTDPVTQIIESRIIGQKPTIAETVMALRQSGSVSLVFGPEGVGKLSLIKETAHALNIPCYVLNLSQPEFQNSSNLFYFVGLVAKQNENSIIVFEHIEYLNETMQEELAELIRDREITLNFEPSESAPNPEPLKVKLNQNRFVLVSNQGEYFFRNPIGFRYQNRIEPDSDELLKAISDQKVKDIFSGRYLTENLINDIQHFIPVRRLSESEFRSALYFTIEDALSNYNDYHNKEFILDRKHELIQHLTNQYYEKGHSTYHQINELVSDALEINQKADLFSINFSQNNQILLKWNVNKLGTQPVPMSCDALGNGKSPTNSP